MQPNKILTQIFNEGFYQKTVTIAGTDLQVTLRTISSGDQHEIDKMMSGKTDSSKVILGEYTHQVLSRVLVSAGDQKFISPENAMKWILSIPSTMVIALVRMHQDLEAEVAKAFNLEDIEKTFTRRAGRVDESKPSQEESTLESQEASEKV